MKKITFLLLFLIILQQGGLMLWYAIQQYFAQVEMLSELHNPNTPDEHLQLSLAEYNSGKINAFELKWKGKMYDVKSVSIRNGQVAIVVHHDTYEEDVLGKIKALIGHGTDKKIPYPNQFVKIVAVRQDQPAPGTAPPVFFLVSGINFRKYSTALISRSVEVLVPPPDGFQAV